MPTLQKTLGTREFTTEALNTLSFRLLASGLSFQRESDLVYQLLDQRGRLLISQIAPNFQVGQAIFELYVPFYSPSHPFEIAFTSRATGSLFGSLTDVLQDVGASGLTVATLDNVHMLIHNTPVPGPSRYFTIMDEVNPINFSLTRTFKTFQDRKFLDLSVVEVPHNFKLIRNHISNTYEAGISLNGIP